MKKNLLFWGALSLLAPISLTACSDDENKGEDPGNDGKQEQLDGELCDNLSGWSVKARNSATVALELTTKESRAIAENNKLANKILAASRSESENTMISPISMNLAVAMLNNGAYNDVQARINSALGMSNMTMDEVNNLYAKISASLNSNLDSSSIFDTQNAMWVQSEFPVRKNYYDILTKTYEASISNLDFSSPGFTDTIDAWANKATRGLIPNLGLKLPPNLVIILSNACYFKGDWTTPFQYDFGGAFKKADSTINKNAFFMVSPTIMLDYEETDNYQAVRIPYGNGTFCMDLVVPTEKSNTKELLSTINWDGFNYEKQNVVINMVQFKAQNKFSMKESLSNLGFNELFGTQLDKISKGVYLYDMQQNTYIEVDKSGTKAAAVTTGLLVEKYTPNDPAKQITTDNPFIYAIREAKTGIILFMGEVVNADEYDGNMLDDLYR